MPPYVATPRKPLPDGWEAGERIRLTSEYTSQFPALRSSRGLIVGGSGEQNCCRVRLDGYRAAFPLNVKYLSRDNQ